VRVPLEGLFIDLYGLVYSG